MEVWVIESGACNYGDHFVLGVFAGTELDAQAYAERLGRKIGADDAQATGPFPLGSAE